LRKISFGFPLKVFAISVQEAKILYTRARAGVVLIHMASPTLCEPGMPHQNHRIRLTVGLHNFPHFLTCTHTEIFLMLASLKEVFFPSPRAENVVGNIFCPSPVVPSVFFGQAWNLFRLAACIGSTGKKSVPGRSRDIQCLFFFLIFLLWF
jgi:hypothetical protein